MTSYSYEPREISFVFKCLVNVSFYLAIAFFFVCLACGFYFIAELSEEYTVTTRKILRYSIFCLWGVFAVLWVAEGLPFHCVLTGILTHAAYFTLLKTFPFVSLLSPQSLLSIGAFVVSHAVWYLYFTHPLSPEYTYGHLLGFFFVCVWLVPFGFFVTVTPDRMALPGSGGIDSPAADIGLLGGGGGVPSKKRPKLTHYLAAWATRLKTAVLGDDSARTFSAKFN